MMEIGLECSVLEHKDGTIKVKIELQDGTFTCIEVNSILTDKLREKTYVEVESIGARNQLVYIKLPAPSLEHGELITVKSNKIIPKKNIVL